MPIPTPTCACEGREYISGSINAITNAKYFMSLMVISPDPRPPAPNGPAGLPELALSERSCIFELNIE